MEFTVETRGHYDFKDITPEVLKIVKNSKIKSGVAHIFVTGSTAGITTMEFEEGIMKDLKMIFENWAPEHADYEHHKKWGDHNGAAHIKAAIIGPSLSIPIENNKLATGTWQQISLIDFDEKPRTRSIIVKIIESNI